jgi:hypothetical protein
MYCFDFETENGYMQQKRVTCDDQVSVNFSNAAGKLIYPEYLSTHRILLYKVKKRCPSNRP